MSLWTHLRTLAIPKCVFVEVEKAILQWPSLHIQPIFGLWTRPKSYLGEVNKATFLVVARHCELIFCLFTSPKCDLGEVEKATIQVVEWHFEVTFHFLTMSLNSFSASWSSKMRLCWDREAMFQGPAWKFQPTIGLWTCPKANWVNSIKRLFKWL